MQGLKPVRKIVYAKVHRWSKDCLRRETNAVFPTLRSRSNSFRNDSSKQKILHLLAWKLHDECPAFVSVEIICFEHLQQGSYEKLNPGIFFQGYVQPNAPQVATMIAVWKIIIVFRSSSWNFSSPHYVTYFVRQYLQTVMEKVTS